jgi:fatty-acyl-CoA synthase
MRGLMQDWPLTVDRVLDHAARVHGTREIVARRCDGGVHRSAYATLHQRARAVSAALAALGIAAGDRVATLAWNSDRHMECWYGAMGIGAVLHTLNPRLHPDRIAWIANQAADRVLVLDADFVPLVESIRGQLKTIEHFVILADAGAMPVNRLGARCYEDWIGEGATQVQWGGFDELTACGLCYTSGTTGDPKGVLYSHRSNVLHAMMALQPNAFGIGAADVVMPMVPMFHANAWGLAFACPMAGAKMVQPGSQLDGASIYELLNAEKVTLAAAVPTVWMGLLQHLRAEGLSLPHLRRVVIGGAALPESILRAYTEDYGVEVIHAWGMTETSPIGTLNPLPPSMQEASPEAQAAYGLRQGRPPFGVELKIVDDTGAVLPHDDRSVGHLRVRGFAIAAAYYAEPDRPVLDEHGFFDTGDIAAIDALGTMRITDRAKDVIKSGGEWISSIELEQHAQSHERVALAAAIGVPHPKWDERPVLAIEPAAGASVCLEDMRSHLADKVPKWWLPEDIMLLERLPLGATGKVDKLRLRALYAQRRGIEGQQEP